MITPRHYLGTLFKSNQIKQLIISNRLLVFEEKEKPEHPEKNLSKLPREPTNYSAPKLRLFSCGFVLCPLLSGNSSRNGHCV